MPKIIGVLVAIFLSSCSQKPTTFTKERLVSKAPNSPEDLGWLISSVKKEEMRELLVQFPMARVRVISPRHDLYEVYNVHEKDLEVFLPRAILAKNEFYSPMNLTNQENSLSFMGKSPALISENQAQPELCRNANKKLKAIIKVNLDKEEISTPTFYIGQRLHLKALASQEGRSDNLRYIWAVQPPENSLQTKELYYGPQLDYSLQALGYYQVSLLVQDEENFCDTVFKGFTVTSNEDYIYSHQDDMQRVQTLGADLSLFKHLQQLNINQVWPKTTGKNQVIAIIDSGVNYNHFALKNLQFNDREVPDNNIDDDNNGYVDDYLGLDLSNNDPFPFDDHGHGSHVAGLAASPLFGIAKGAKILAIKAMSPSGSDAGTLAGGIYYAIDRGAKIINISVGNYSQPHPHLLQAIQLAQSHQVIIVAAAGNGDRFLGLPVNTDLAPNFPSSFPHDNIISVAAHSNGFALAPYSNYGFQTVDIVAPGGDDNDPLYSAYLKNPKNVELKGLSGTSMASPLVAGTIALLWELQPELTLYQIKQLIMQCRVPITEIRTKINSSCHLDILHYLAQLNLDKQIDAKSPF